MAKTAIDWLALILVIAGGGYRDLEKSTLFCGVYDLDGVDAYLKIDLINTLMK
jgi:hypothetical protein